MNDEILNDEVVEPTIDESAEVVEPQEDEQQESNNSVDGNELPDTDAPAEDEKPKQSKEIDSAFANARKRAEEAEKRASELEAQRARDEQVRTNFAEYGVYSEAEISKKYGDSHGIHTFEDMQKAVLEEQYAEQGIDPKVISQMIDNHPAIKEAQKIKENTMIANQYNQLLNDLKSDGLDTIKAPTDIPKNVYDKWNYGKSGLTLSDCYYLAERKNIESKKINATKQATLNNLNGKKHLNVQSDGSNTATDTSVPAETLQYFQDMGMNKKEALTYYKKIYG